MKKNGYCLRFSMRKEVRWAEADWLVLLLDAAREANISGGYFCVELVTQPTVHPYHCELDAMLCRGLSECLHVLMWVNQHRWPCLSASPAVVLRLWGGGTPSEPWQPGTLMVSGVESGDRVLLPHQGSDPVAKARRSQRVLFIVAAYLAILVLFSPAWQH